MYEPNQPITINTLSTQGHPHKLKHAVTGHPQVSFLHKCLCYVLQMQQMLNSQMQCNLSPCFASVILVSKINFQDRNS